MREDLIERLRDGCVLRPKRWSCDTHDDLGGSIDEAATDALMAEAAAALEAAREDACVALVADIRFACGDNGKRMQPELVEFIRGLAADSSRYQWLRENEWDREDTFLSYCDDELDAAIDQARGKGAAE